MRVKQENLERAREFFGKKNNTSKRYWIEVDSTEARLCPVLTDMEVKAYRDFVEQERKAYLADDGDETDAQAWQEWLKEAFRQSDFSIYVDEYTGDEQVVGIDLEHPISTYLFSVAYRNEDTLVDLYYEKRYVDLTDEEYIQLLALRMDRTLLSVDQLYFLLPKVYEKIARKCFSEYACMVFMTEVDKDADRILSTAPDRDAMLAEAEEVFGRDLDKGLQRKEWQTLGVADRKFFEERSKQARAQIRTMIEQTDTQTNDGPFCLRMALIYWMMYMEYEQVMPSGDAAVVSYLEKCVYWIDAYKQLTGQQEPIVLQNPPAYRFEVPEQIIRRDLDHARSVIRRRREKGKK